MIWILMLPKFGFPPTDLCNRPLIPWIWEPKFFKGQSNVRQWTLQCLNWMVNGMSNNWETCKICQSKLEQSLTYEQLQNKTHYFTTYIYDHFFFTDNYTYYSQLIWKLDPLMPLSLLAFYPTIIIRQGRWEMTVMKDYLLKSRK